MTFRSSTVYILAGARCRDDCEFARHRLCARLSGGGIGMTSERLTPVIMCGGAGTRLWPVSRESMPKQFVPLIGDRSTFQQTIERISGSNIFARPIVITNAEFRFLVAEQLRACA